MVQQDYSIGQPFNTYLLSDLTAQDSYNWTWPGRTLVGYISANGNDDVIQLGQEVIVDASTMKLSGVWELNKRDLSIYIINGGNDSYVEVETGTLQYDASYEQNCRPLTDETIKNITSAYNNDIVKFWYNSYISCIIHPGENYIISTVYFDQNNAIEIDHPIDQGNVSSITYPISNAILNPIFGHAVINKSLSVYLTESGTTTLPEETIPEGTPVATGVNSFNYGNDLWW